jgi:predicted nucleotidyltransferase
MEAPAYHAWEITPDKVESAIRKIIEVAQPRRIILFGSYVRNVHGRDSDVDFLVVVGDEVENPPAHSLSIQAKFPHQVSLRTRRELAPKPAL